VQRVGDIVRSHGRDVVNWVEVYERLGSKLDNRTIVHVWKSKTELSKASACMQIGYCVWRVCMHALVFVYVPAGKRHWPTCMLFKLLYALLSMGGEIAEQSLELTRITGAGRWLPCHPE